MKTVKTLGFSAVTGLLTFVLLIGCDVVPIPDLDDIIDGDGITASMELEDFATNTGGASGMALRPSDGALFIVNEEGLFGPIAQGDDVSTLSPIGAENLGTTELFGEEPSRVLAISDAGDFWIGSRCCGTLVRIPAGGGDPEPFTGLLEGAEPANIFAQTLVFVPDEFDGDDIDPGDLLVGEDTTFSRLAAINTGTGMVTNVANPGELDREGHHLTFGPDGTLYSSQAVAEDTVAGIQTIATDGLPTPLPGTIDVSANTFVVLANGDLVIRGSFEVTPPTVHGVFFWSAEDQEVVPGVKLSTGEFSPNDEMVITPDGSTIYLSLPGLNKIVRVVDNR